MPQGEHLHLTRQDPVVEEVPDAAQVNAANALQFRIGCVRSHLGLLRKERKRALKFFLESLRRFVAIGQPPRTRLLDLCVGASCD
jgi:hypothetical protein